MRLGGGPETGASGEKSKLCDTMTTRFLENNMLRVVIFDLGETLIDGARRPFPHVKETLTVISRFVSEDGKPLRSCLVSDFTMLPAGATPAKVAAVFNDYLAILDATGLRPFFEPVKQRVTISTQA